MDPKQYAEKVKADAIAKGATPEAAEAAFKSAEAEAATIMGHPLYQGLVAVNQEIAGRVTPLKEQLEQAAPLIEAGRKALDANKTAETRLAELQAENAKKDAALVQERRNNAIRLAAIAGGVNPEAAIKLADLSGVKDDGTGAKEAIAAVVKQYPGLVEAEKTRSPLAEGNGGGGTGATMKRAEYDTAAPHVQNEFIKKGGKVVD